MQVFILDVVFHPHLDAHFHRSAEGAVHRGAEDHQRAHLHRYQKINAVDGRTAGSFEGFNYSQANKSSGITWNQESFTKYIRAPMQEMPGTRMAFVGIKNDNDIANLWAYLKQFKANGSK